MDDEGGMFIVGLIVGLLVSAMIMVMLIGSDKKELGQAICEEEYGMDYDRYSTEEGLHCQPKVIKSEEKYDGIQVKLEANKDGIESE